MTFNDKSLDKKYTVGGLFSGIGGIELGFLQNDFEVLWSNDIDLASSVTFRSNFDHQHILEDIHKLKGNELKAVDVLVGGFPCQAFSVAGYRKGFDDIRGNLFFEIIRLIEELEYKPKALLLENVKNLYSHDSGKTFKVVKQTLEDLGYSVFTKILNTSQFTNIPQNRERTFIICFLEGADAIFDQSKVMSQRFNMIFPPKPINKTDHIKNYLETTKVDEKFYYRDNRYMYKELEVAITSSDTVYQWRRQYVRENKSNVCPTLTANMGTGGHNVPLIKDEFGIRKLTPRECFNLQGFPSDYILPTTIAMSQLYKQAGNSVTVAMIGKIASLIKEALEIGYKKN